MKEKRIKTLESEPVSDEEVAALLREQGTSSIEEIPEGTEIIEGKSWDELLEKLARSDEAIRKSHDE